MNSVPVTYLFVGADETALRTAMPEFAANGVQSVVLSDQLISAVMGKFSFADTIKKYSELTGVKFVDSHAPFGPGIDLNVPDADAHKRMILRHKLAMNIAADFGVDTMTIHVGNDLRFPDVPLNEQFDWVIKSLEELLPEAEKCGITICIENIWFRLNTPDMLLKMKSHFPTDNLGFCYDAGHANLMTQGRSFDDGAANYAWGSFNETPDWNDPILEKMLPHIVNCHIHDNNGCKDDHQLCGSGSVDWKRIIPLLKSAPGLKNMQCESISSKHNFSVREMISTTREVLKY
ncbi:MAG: sugar phosphate isomerase/epimerase [Lentisphaeria bacterium]|nr:sugar phosphate isomerase/epimerase [Lentisphaeria bacterium]